MCKTVFGAQARWYSLTDIQPVIYPVIAYIIILLLDLLKASTRRSGVGH